MNCGVALTFFKPVLIVAGLAAVGMGGFNFATTGCPLGMCWTSDQNANAVTVANPGDDALPKSGCCAAEAEQGALLVADTTEASPEGICTEAMKAACESAGECPFAKEACEAGDAADCPHPAPTEKVADSAATESDAG